MALTQTHQRLTRRSGQDLRDRLRAALVFRRLTNTFFTGRPVAGEKIELVYQNDPAANDQPSSVSTQRTPSWTASAEIGSEIAEMEINRSANEVRFLPYADIESSPFNQIEAANTVMARRIALAIDNDVATAMIAVPNESGRQASQREDFGANGNYIDANGKVTGTDARDYVVDAFINAAKWMIANNMVGTGERDLTAWAACPGALWAAWLDFLKAEKPSDSLFNMFVGPGSRGITDVDRQNNIRVVLTNKIPTANVGGKVHQQIIFGTNHAVSLGVARSLMSSVPATQNTTGKIGSSYGQAMFWGRTVLNPEQLRVARIRRDA